MGRAVMAPRVTKGPTPNLVLRTVAAPGRPAPRVLNLTGMDLLLAVNDSLGEAVGPQTRTNSRSDPTGSVYGFGITEVHLRWVRPVGAGQRL